MFESLIVGAGVSSSGLYRSNLNERLPFQTKTGNISSMSPYVYPIEHYVIFHRKGRLMKDDSLQTLPDSFGGYAECINEKLTEIKRNGSKRSLNLP